MLYGKTYYAERSSRNFGVSALQRWTRPVTMALFLMCNMCRMAVCTLPRRAFKSISQNAPTEQSQQKRTQHIVNLAELECEPVRILVEIIMV